MSSNKKRFQIAGLSSRTVCASIKGLFGGLFFFRSSAALIISYLHKYLNIIFIIFMNF